MSRQARQHRIPSASAWRSSPGRKRPRGSRRQLWGGVAFLLLAAASSRAEPTVYPVSGFTLRYASENPALPGLEEFAGIEVTLGHDGEAYVAAQPRMARTAFRLGRVPDAPAPQFRPSALRSISEQLVAALETEGLSGLRVFPDPRDIDPGSGADLRGGFRQLRLVLSVATVTAVVTEPGSDHGASAPELERIRARSPLQPGTPLREGELRAYLARLSRDSGRAVVAQLRPSHEPGEVTVHYRVAEDRPWSAWLQVSNTGTEATSPARQRMGFLRRRLLADADVLGLDYVTGGFDSVHAATGSYELPLPGTERWRWRVDASWSRFDSSQLGLHDAFSGRQWDIGTQLVWNFFQHDDLFLDALVGLRFQDLETRDRISELEGASRFLLPEVGLRLERTSDTHPIHAALVFERNLAGLAGTEVQELDSMGRSGVDEQFSILHFDAGLSFFPGGWFSSAQRDAPASRLSHEIALAVGGQHAFGHRLVPYHQQTLGGLYSVRGYPQSIAAGDTVIRGSAEYRLHLGRLLGSTDLPLLRDSDLMLRAFVDAGRALQSDRLAQESHDTLVGAGLGLELRFRRYLRLRFDWGRALETVPHSLEAGSSEYHAVATLLY